MTTEPVAQKVTAFVVRPGKTGAPDELLLFEHPFAGFQLPAGTVEEDEPPEIAVLREAHEETGLSGFETPEFLGHDEWRPPDNRYITLKRTTVYGRPDPLSFDWAYLPRGFAVDVLREADGYVQVCYTEWDRLPDPQYPTMQITGWVPAEHLTRLQRRYYYLLPFHRETPLTWTVEIDHHRFRLFWARLDALPRLIGYQGEWLRFLTDRYPGLRLVP